MPADDPDLAAFASDVQQLASRGSFDPFALLAGSHSFHSVVLAPFSPQLRRSLTRFQERGDGPLGGAIEVLRTQGNLTLEAATTRAHEMFNAAQGMLVVIMAGDQGLSSIPQLFFGHLSEEYRRHAVAACGAEFSGREALTRALADLAAKAAGGTTWPALIAGPEAGSKVLTYWLELASGVVSSQEQLLPRDGGERLADLGHWIASAVALLAEGRVLEGDDLMALASCRLAAGEWREAAELIDACVGAGVDQEELLELVTQWADVAAGVGVGREAGDWLSAALPRFEQTLGKSYDLARAVFRLKASAQVPSAELISAAELMMARDRKSCRHDLTREPLWAVRLADPGTLLDTAQAAAAIGRSHTFVAKRLDQGTIPSHRREEQVRLPQAALEAWKAVMDHFALLEG